MVASRIRTFLLVTFFTVVIWLFAEGESLKKDEVSTRIVFSAGSTSTYVVPEVGWREGGWNGSVRIALEGTTDAIDEARSVLVGQVTLTAGLGRVPAENGVYTLNLLDALQEQERIRRSGVTIQSVSPAQGTIRVRELNEEDLRIKVELPGVEVDGEPTPTPRDSVKVLVPTDLKESLTTEGKWPPQVVATVPPERLAGLRAGASVDRQADLILPPELAGDPAVTPPTARVNITFTVKARLESWESRVPVWVLLPAGEAGGWSVELELGDELVGVIVTGPLAQVERLRSKEDRLVAVVTLTIDDVTQRVTSKPLGFALLGPESTLPLPTGMRVEPERASQPLTITRVGETE